jgi:hypothetical protein
VSNTILGNAPMPLDDAIASPARWTNKPDPQSGKLTSAWVEFFSRLTGNVQANPTRVGSASVTGQYASISPTDLSNGTFGAGLYRISYYVRITQAAAVSSSITISLDWTDSGVACAYSGPALTSNATNASQSNSQLIVIDTSSPVRYSTTYASSGAPFMKYRLSVTIEQVNA